MALLLGTSLARPAAACSLADPWGINDPTLIAFIGSPLRDTVLAPPIRRRPLIELPGVPTDEGREVDKPAYGQRVRIEQMGERARNALPPNTREVVLVPWAYEADCSTVPWDRSARWLPDSLRGLFRLRLRPRAEWAQGLPTFDVSGTQFQPYRERASRSSVRGTAVEPRVTERRLLTFYDAPPPQRVEPDTMAAMDWLKRVRADTALNGRYPVNQFAYAVRYQFTRARANALRIPIAGTFRLAVSVDSTPPRPLFLRVGSTIASTQDSMRGVPDTALTPRLPEGYYLYATAATDIDRLLFSCVGARPNQISYVDLDWHGPWPPDMPGEWKGGIDPAILDVVLTDAERAAWKARRDAASRAYLDSIRTSPDSLRARGFSRPFGFAPNRPLRVTRSATGAVQLEGTITIPLMGTFRVRGERLSQNPFICGR